MPVNIKRVSATRLLEEMVKKVVGYPKVMCVDPLGMRIVSSCLKVRVPARPLFPYPLLRPSPLPFPRPPPKPTCTCATWDLLPQHVTRNVARSRTCRTSAWP